MKTRAAGLVFGVLSLVGLVFLFFGGTGARSLRSFERLWDLGHVLLFFCGAQWALRAGLWAEARGRAVRVLAWAVALGALTELLQGFTGGDAQWGDLARDVVGAASGLAFFSPSSPSSVSPRPRGAGGWEVAAAVCLFLSFVPLVRALWDEHSADRDFPILSDLEGWGERERWEGNADLSLSGRVHRSGLRALRVKLGTEEYSGAFLVRFPGDWRGYSRLRFSVFNPDRDTLALECRLHDEAHDRRGRRYDDRFNARIVARPGWTDFDIPLAGVARAPKSREFDLGRVKGFGVFSARLPSPRSIFLDAVRLER